MIPKNPKPPTPTPRAKQFCTCGYPGWCTACDGPMHDPDWDTIFDLHHEGHFDD